MRARDVRLLALILAGGEGTRLQPLTRDRAKPAVPFGGRYRLIDFVLSNFVNSGYFQVKVLTQYNIDNLARFMDKNNEGYISISEFSAAVSNAFTADSTLKT